MNTNCTISACCAAPHTYQDQTTETAAMAPGAVAQDDIRRPLDLAAGSAHVRLYDAADNAAAQLDVLAHLDIAELTGDHDGYGYYLLITGISRQLREAMLASKDDEAQAQP